MAARYPDQDAEIDLIATCIQQLPPDIRSSVLGRLADDIETQLGFQQDINSVRVADAQGHSSSRPPPHVPPNPSVLAPHTDNERLSETSLPPSDAERFARDLNNTGSYRLDLPRSLPTLPSGIHFTQPLASSTPYPNTQPRPNTPRPPLRSHAGPYSFGTPTLGTYLPGGSHSTPKLSSFSGEKSKGDVQYKQWRLEIVGCCRENSFSDIAILNAMRRAAKGAASDLLSGLSDPVSLDTAVEQLGLVFGNVLPGETLMERFYTARQERSETVASWSCRLRELVSKIESTGTFPPNAAASLLRSRFWMGLTRDDLKQATRHHFDSDIDFNRLFLAVRRVEEEHVSPAVHSFPHSCSEPSPTQGYSTQLEDVIVRLKNLDATMKQMGDRMKTLEARREPPGNLHTTSKRVKFDKSSTQSQGGTSTQTDQAIYCYDCGMIGVRRRHSKCPALNG